WNRRGRSARFRYCRAHKDGRVYSRQRPGDPGYTIYGRGVHAAYRWGHSSLSSVVSLALDADVRKLLLFHHDPNHDDQMIDKMVEHARALVAKSGKPLEVEGAREGAEILLGAKTPAA